MQTPKYDSPRIQIFNLEMKHASCIAASNVDSVNVYNYYDDSDFDY